MKTIALLFLVVPFSRIVSAQTSDCIENLKRATEFFSVKDYISALNEYNMVIERSGYYDAYLGRGITYHMLNHDTLALGDFYNVTVQMNHLNDTSYHWFVGKSHQRLSQWEWAYKHYKHAELNGMSLKGTLGLDLGTTCYFLSLNDDAYKYMNVYLKFNEGVSDAWTNFGWISIGKLNYDSALYSFEKAYTIGQKEKMDQRATAKLFNNLGHAYGLKGNLKKGEKLIMKSIELDPRNSFSYRNLGLIYKERKNKSKACENLRKAQELGIEREWGREFIKELIQYCM